MSFIWTAGTGYKERVPQAKELKERYHKWSGMGNDPVFALDNCCTDRKWLEDGGFDNPFIVGDVYHISKRIITTVSSENRALLGFFASDLRKCFGSSKPGVFWPAEKIISAVERVKVKYQEENVALWTEGTTKCFENEKHHITECLALPEVYFYMHSIKYFFYLYYLTLTGYLICSM